MFPALNGSARGSYDFFQLAIDEIYETYGHRVVIGRKSIQKFGRGQAMPTGRTEINSLNQNEVYLTDNLITHFSSSDAGDFDNVVVEGMQLVGGVYVFKTQTVILQGQTKVALEFPLLRATRAYNDDTTDITGDVYFYEDTPIVAGVPTDLTKAHLQILGDTNQSEKASTSVANNNYCALVNSYAYVNRKQAAQANIQLRTRVYDNAFRTVFVGSVDSTADSQLSQSDLPFRIIRPNSDITMTANCSVNGVDISAGFTGFFLDIV